jgi:hypothetical protein
VSGHGGYASGYSGGYYRGRTVVIPYAVPAFGYGYYGDPGYGYGNAYTAPTPADDQPAPPPPPDDVSVPIPQPDDSALKIYQAPAHTTTPEEIAMSEGRYYLIAYKDHSIYTALAYWMENGALNYVTPQSAHNQVSLDLVDLDLTKQLNARRGYPFNLVNR